MNTRKKILGSIGETEDHVPWICLPQGDLPTVHSHYTHRSSALPGGPLGGLPSLSLTTKGSWIHLGGGSPRLSSAPWRQYPRLLKQFTMLRIQRCVAECIKCTDVSVALFCDH